MEERRSGLLRRARCVYVGAALLTVLAAPALCVSAQEAAPPPERNFSLNLRQVPLREALARLFRGSGLNYAVDTGVPDVPVTVSVHDVPFAKALSTLLQAGSTRAPDLTFQIGGGVYLITNQPVRGPLDGVEEPIWLKLRLTGLDARELAVFFDWPLFPRPISYAGSLWLRAGWRSFAAPSRRTGRARNADAPACRFRRRP